MHDALVHMYWTAKWDTNEGFRDELSHFVSGIMSNIEKYIQIRGDQRDVGIPPFLYPSTDKYAISFTTFPSLILFLPGPYLSQNGPWWPWK